jgi:hypothetical protein
VSLTISTDAVNLFFIDTAAREGMSGAPVIAIADGDFEVEGTPPAYRRPGRVSKNSVDRRGYIQKELRLALEKYREKLVDDIFLIPVMLDDIDIDSSVFFKFYTVSVLKTAFSILCKIAVIIYILVVVIYSGLRAFGSYGGWGTNIISIGDAELLLPPL